MCAKIGNDCGFLRTSMKFHRVVEHDPLSNFRSGATLDFIFGDL